MSAIGIGSGIGDRERGEDDSSLSIVVSSLLEEEDPSFLIGEGIVSQEEDDPALLSCTGSAPDEEP